MKALATALFALCLGERYPSVMRALGDSSLYIAASFAFYSFLPVLCAFLPAFLTVVLCPQNAGFSYTLQLQLFVHLLNYELSVKECIFF